jgi:hypothetical protein
MKERPMKKLLTAALVLMSPVAFAIEPSGTTAWGCAAPAFFDRSGNNLAYCGVSITSGTTTAQLGSISVNPQKQVFVSARAEQAALSGLVTPTLTLSLGGNVVATQTISATSAGNLVGLGTVPYFDTVTVSFTNPQTISATNTVRLTVIENR